MHTYKHTHIPTHIYMIHTYIHTYTKKNTYTRTHVYTYIHTYILLHTHTHSFYEGRIRHGIRIPDIEKEEMLQYLQEGPPEGQPPAWINWDDGADPPDDGAVSSLESDVQQFDEDSEEDYVSFLHLPKNKGGKKCRCGSDTHLTVNSHRYVNPNTHTHTHSPTHTLTHPLLQVPIESAKPTR